MTPKREGDAGPETFGPYLVYERVGIGGMATVHRAKERGIEGFERIVALKRLLPHLAEDESFVRAFVREAKLASLLQHANIVQLYELGRVGGQYFISMEYIEGRDIRKILRKSKRVTGPPPINVTVSLLLQLCDALDYAHTRVDENGAPLGIVHRDVSPSNLLVTSSGHLKIIDFGIAKAQALHLRTQTGRVKGKLAYMAPEAITGQGIDSRSDLFSAGVIAHELLTARPLFATKNEYQTLMRVQKSDVAPPSTLNRDCPPELDAVVLKALAKDPDERWRSAADIRDVLHEVRTRYQLSATNREVGAWMEWAFALDSPVTGRVVARTTGTASGPSRSISFSDSAPSPGSTSAPPSAPSLPTNTPHEIALRTPDTGPRDYAHGAAALPPLEADDAVIEIAWGNQSEDDAVPVLLDEVPDVSDKIVLPTHEATSVEPASGDTKVGYVPPPPGVRPRAQTRGKPKAPQQWAKGTQPPPIADSEAMKALEEMLAEEQRRDDGGAAAETTPFERSAPARRARRDSRAATEFGAAIVEQHGAARIVKIGLVLAVFAAAGAFLYFARGDRSAAELSADAATVEVEVEPADATIVVEGHEPHVGTPFELELEPGTYAIEVRAAGHASWVSTIDVEPNEHQTVRVALPAATAGGDGAARISLQTDPPGFEIAVDDEPVEGSTPVELELEPGTHVITLSSEYGEVWRKEIVAEADTRYELHPSLERAARETFKRYLRHKKRQEERVAGDDGDVESDGEAVEYEVDHPAAIGGAPPTPAAGALTRNLRGLDIDTSPPPEAPRKKSERAARVERLAPVVVPPGAVTKVGGSVPVIRSDRVLPGMRINAKLCIDRRGRVSSAKVLTEVPSAVNGQLRRALSRWRYRPYESDGEQVPACFVVSFQLK